MDKTTNNYTIRIPNDTREKLERIAEAEGRSLSNLILWFIRKGVEEYESRKQS